MNRHDIIAIGGSLGAVEAVTKLCMDLPGDLAAAVFVVIHVGAKGNDLLAEIFNAHSALTISTAVDGEQWQRGHVYIAPADHHLLVMGEIIRLGRGPRENMSRPAIDPLFRSVAASFGPRVIAVVLTGMLNDGTAGLADVSRCGGITVVQSPADAIAPEMPSGALRGSEVGYRAPLAQMARLLTELSNEEVPGEVTTAALKLPQDIEHEIEIALGRRSDSELLAKFADPVPMTCPACGGVLSQVKRPPLRFRCQVGHAYSADTLSTEKEATVDEAMRVALRIMEERTVLTIKMAGDARQSGLDAAASSYELRADESRAYADTLRNAITGF